MSRTLFGKIWDRHLVSRIDDRTGLLLIDRVMLHERTGGVALKSVLAAGRSVLAPDQTFAVMDHIVDTRPGRTDQTLMPLGSPHSPKCRLRHRNQSLTPSPSRCWTCSRYGRRITSPMGSHLVPSRTSSRRFNP